MESAASLLAKYPDTKDCFVLEKQVLELQNLVSYYNLKLNFKEARIVADFLFPKEAYFKASGCDVTVQKKLYEAQDKLLNQYAAKAEKEITPGSVEQRNKLIFISGGTLALGLCIILLNNMKK